MKCEYCLADRATDHACLDTPTMRKRQARTPVNPLTRIDTIIREIKHSQVHPNWKAQTSNQMRQRAKQQRDMATGIKLAGGKVKPEWLP